MRSEARTLLSAFAPGALFVFPELRCLIETVYEEAKLLALIVGKAESECLVRLSVAADHDRMPSANVELIYQNALRFRQSNRYSVVYLNGEIKRCALHLG